MATTVVLTAVVKEAGGRCRVQFSDGSELEFNTLEEAKAWAREPDTDIFLTKRLCLAYALGRSEDLSNINSVKDKNFTFDLTNNSPIRVQ